MCSHVSELNKENSFLTRFVKQYRESAMHLYEQIINRFEKIMTND